jgi:hypothetical protein
VNGNSFLWKSAELHNGNEDLHDHSAVPEFPPHIAFMARSSDPEVSDPRRQTSTTEEDERKIISLGEYRSRRSAPQHPTSPEGPSCSEDDLTATDFSAGNKEIREKIARIDRQIREHAEERRRLQSLLQLRRRNFS